MATTINIPLTTLIAGGQDLSTPAEPIGSFTSFLFSINANVGVTPLESLIGNVIEMHVEYSRDGGVTWPVSDSQTIAGGTALMKDGVTLNHVRAWGSTFPFGFTHARARIHAIQGATVSGSLILSP